MKNLFVVGFLFSPCRDYVALIRKNKPAWQHGMLNGIGGKVEEGETPHGAMVREFAEEAGRWHSEWDCFCNMRIPQADTRIFFFRAFLRNEEDIKTVSSRTDEIVGWYFKPDWKPSLNLIPNLRWLIPMALSGERANVEEML